MEKGGWTQGSASQAGHFCHAVTLTTGGRELNFTTFRVLVVLPSQTEGIFGSTSLRVPPPSSPGKVQFLPVVPITFPFTPALLNRRRGSFGSCHKQPLA